MTGVLTQGETGHTNSHRTSEDEGRDGGDTSPGKMHQRPPASRQYLGQRGETGSPSQHSEGSNSAKNLDLDFRLQKYKTINFCFFKLLRCWYLVAAALTN